MKRTLILSVVALFAANAHAAVGPGCAVRNDGSSICMNDRVLDYRGVTGFVQEMYPNGIMVVRYDDGSIYQINPYNLAREVSTFNTYSFGSRIYDQNNNIGTIFDLFENGAAEITLDAYPNRYFIVSINRVISAGVPAVAVTHSWPAPRPYPDPVPAPAAGTPAPAPQPWPAN